MTDTVIFNIKKKLLSKIKKKLKYIIDGYEVVFEEQDGCDEYGYMYWIECKNGYSSRSWNLNSQINEDIENFYLRLFIDGIYYRNKRYFIKPSQNISSVKDITLIDYDEYMIYYNNNKKYNMIINTIINKINDSDIYYKNRIDNYNRNMFIYQDLVKTILNIKIKHHMVFSNKNVYQVLKEHDLLFNLEI